MRAKFLILVAVMFLLRGAHADNAITFSSALPKHWTQLSSQIIPGTNAVSHEAFNEHKTVLQDSTNLTTMMISVVPVPPQPATSDLALEAKSWVLSVLSRFGENGNIDITRSQVVKENKKTFAETAFSIELQDAKLWGISHYSIVNTNAIGWV